MPKRNRFAWSNQSHEDQLLMAQHASREDLRQMARAFDWSTDHDAVLSHLMANKLIDLASAVTVFFNGDPARFNYIAKRSVPREYSAATSLLDNICLRINSGFYRASPSVRIDKRERLDRWLAFQEADRREGRRGRWILDEAIVQKAVVPPRIATPVPVLDGLRLSDPRPVIEPGPVTSEISRRVAGLWSELTQNGKSG